MASRLGRTLSLRAVSTTERATLLPFRGLATRVSPTFATPTLALLPPQPSPLRRTGITSKATSTLGPQRRLFSSTSLRSSATTTNQQQSNQDDSDSSSSSRPSFSQRIRLLFKRYGWWAFAVYNLWSLVDFSLTWAIIHWAGADYIRQLEASVRNAIGMRQRKTSDEEIAQWPLNGQTPAVLEGVTSPPSGHENNEHAAKEAVQRLTSGVDEEQAAKGGKEESSNSTLWAEAVLAYTIHKTLLLPFRVMGTGALTPTFVKYMVKLGWAKPLAAGGAATAATVGKATSAVASKGVQEAGKKGVATAVRETKP